jgi:hypothetical protein
MYNEATICTIFKNSVIANKGWCAKIPDPASSFGISSQLPFDLFGVLNSKPLYCEVKYISTLKSFDLQRIEDHQIENLMNIQSLLPDSHCWIVLGVKVGRGDVRLYIFNNIIEVNDRRKLRNNYLKKELLTLPYYLVKKGIIDFNTNYVIGETI